MVTPTAGVSRSTAPFDAQPAPPLAPERFAPTEPAAGGSAPTADPRPRTILSASESSWGDLAPSPPPDPTPRREALPPIGPLLAALRRAKDRDAIVRLTCEGVGQFAKTVVFLALRRGVLRGWEARGPHVSADAIRNLWIPATSPSMFQRTLERGEPYEGSFGTSSADDIFRAATGSRGGRVSIHPVRVGGKALGLLCAEGVRHDALGRRRVEELVLAAG